MEALVVVASVYTELHDTRQKLSQRAAMLIFHKTEIIGVIFCQDIVVIETASAFLPEKMLYGHLG